MVAKLFWLVPSQLLRRPSQCSNRALPWSWPTIASLRRHLASVASAWKHQQVAAAPARPGACDGERSTSRTGCCHLHASNSWETGANHLPQRGALPAAAKEAVELRGASHLAIRARLSEPGFRPRMCSNNYRQCIELKPLIFGLSFFAAHLHSIDVGLLECFSPFHLRQAPELNWQHVA